MSLAINVSKYPKYLAKKKKAKALLYYRIKFIEVLINLLIKILSKGNLKMDFLKYLTAQLKLYQLKKLKYFHEFYKIVLIYLFFFFCQIGFTLKFG